MFCYRHDCREQFIDVNKMVPTGHDLKMKRYYFGTRHPHNGFYIKSILYIG